MGEGQLGKKTSNKSLEQKYIQSMNLRISAHCADDIGNSVERIKNELQSNADTGLVW